MGAGHCLGSVSYQRALTCTGAGSLLVLGSARPWPRPKSAGAAIGPGASAPDLPLGLRPAERCGRHVILVHHHRHSHGQGSWTFVVSPWEGALAHLAPALVGLVICNTEVLLALRQRREFLPK